MYGVEQKDQIPFNKLFGTVIAERVFDLIVLLLIIVAIVLFQIDRIGGFINEVIIKPLLGNYTNNINAIIIVLISTILFLAILYVIFRWLKPWLQKTMLYSKIEEFLNGLWGGIKSIAQVKNKTYFFFNTFMIWFYIW